MGLELCFFVVFPGIALLFGQDIKDDWNQWKQGGHRPWYLMGWVASGLLYAFCRVQSGRYAVSEARSVLSAPAFAEAYRKMLTGAITSLANLSGAGERRDELLVSMESDLLKAIADTGRHFRRATALRCPTVACNLMEPCEVDLKEVDRGWLEPGGESDLECMLKIKKFTVEELDIPAGFILPIYRKDSAFRRKTLFGAPKGYVTGQNQVVNFTLWLLPHKGRSSWCVFNKAYRHFWDVRKTIWSFAALPIFVHGKAAAVANVHYKRFRVLGKNPELLIDFLVPFLVILGYVYAERKRRG